MRYKKVCVESFGYELPETIVTSLSLEEKLAPVYKKLNLRYGRLEMMTGIHERRLWNDEVTPSQASIKAAEKAIKSGNYADAKVAINAAEGLINPEDDKTKARFYNASVRSILIYGCESWQLTAEDIRKLQVFEHKCWRSCLNISYRDRVRNEHVVYVEGPVDRVMTDTPWADSRWHRNSRYSVRLSRRCQGAVRPDRTQDRGRRCDRRYQRQGGTFCCGPHDQGKRRARSSGCRRRHTFDRGDDIRRARGPRRLSQ